MKITVVGSGTAVPNGERNSSGYVVANREVQILLDCGAGIVHALPRYGIDWERLTHLFISHFHVDHLGELASLFFAFRHGMKSSRQEPLTLFAPRGIDRILTLLKEAFGQNLFTPKFPVKVVELEPGDDVQLPGEGRLTVAKTPHTEESLAVKIESDNRIFGYTGDTAFSEPLAQFFSHADLLICECSFAEPNARVPHLSIAEVSRFAALAEVKKLLVTHFYFDVNEATLTQQLAAEYNGQVLIARDGLALEI